MDCHFKMTSKHDILKKAAKEGIPEVISFLITNYIQAVYFFVLIRLGDDLFLARTCVEKIFKEFFLSIASLNKTTNLEHILITISEHVYSQALLQAKIYATYPYSVPYISCEDWKKFHILRSLPFNYHWPLVKFLTKAQNITEPSHQENFMICAKEMYEKALIENNISEIEGRAFLEHFYYNQEEIDILLKQYLKQSWISGEKRIFSFFLSFSAFLLILNAIGYLSFIYHFPKEEKEFEIFFLSFSIIIFLNLLVVKFFAWIKMLYIRKKWNKNVFLH